MRRIILTIPAILGLLFTTGSCVSQGQSEGQSLTQRGMATQEIVDDELTAGHPSLPITSKARITNIANGKEIEVTIAGRIPPSPNRIVDLSPAAALVLDIGKGGPVIINQITARIRPDPPPPPEP